MAGPSHCRPKPLQATAPVCRNANHASTSCGLPGHDLLLGWYARVPGQTGKGPSPGPGRPISRPVTSQGWIGSSLHEQATFNASVRRHDKAPPWAEGSAQQEPANAATDDNRTCRAHGTGRTQDINANPLCGSTMWLARGHFTGAACRWAKLSNPGCIGSRGCVALPCAALRDVTLWYGTRARKVFPTGPARASSWQSLRTAPGGPLRLWEGLRPDRVAPETTLRNALARRSTVMDSLSRGAFHEVGRAAPIPASRVLAMRKVFQPCRTPPLFRDTCDRPRSNRVPGIGGASGKHCLPAQPSPRRPLMLG